MRTLFFLVLIANITLFMWKFKTGALMSTTEMTSQIIVNQEPILLVSELKSALPFIEVAKQIEAKTEPSPVSCYEVGPFILQKDYQHWINALTDSYTIKPINKEEQIPKRYIVLSISNTLEGIETNLQILKKQGITDYFINAPREGHREISLGVFSTEVRAKTMQEQMLAQGINAKIKIEYKTKAQKYLLIRNNNKPFELLTNLQKNYPSLIMKETECW